MIVDASKSLVVIVNCALTPAKRKGLESYLVQQGLPVGVLDHCIASAFADTLTRDYVFDAVAVLSVGNPVVGFTPPAAVLSELREHVRMCLYGNHLPKSLFDRFQTFNLVLRIACNGARVKVIATLASTC